MKLGALWFPLVSIFLSVGAWAHSDTLFIDQVRRLEFEPTEGFFLVNIDDQRVVRLHLFEQAQLRLICRLLRGEMFAALMTPGGKPGRGRAQQQAGANSRLPHIAREVGRKRGGEQAQTDRGGGKAPGPL